jgi:type IV pilus assembly protein PilW
MFPRFRPFPRQRGFSIAELMISMTIGLLILVGMVSLFVNNSKAQNELEKANRQIENGRFGVQVLSGDLRNAGYFGEFDPTPLAAPVALVDPCSTDMDDIKLGMTLPVQGYDNGSGAPSCLTEVKTGTDIVVVRHTATCVAGVGTCSALGVSGPFLQASTCNNNFELGSAAVTDHYAMDLDGSTLDRHDRTCDATAGSGTLAPIRRYLTHIYYVARNSVGSDGIPTLKRAELNVVGGQLAMTIVPLVEGIENIQLEYGLDATVTGIPASYSAAPSSVAEWQSVVSVKLNILARNLEPTQGYTDSRKYVLGMKADGTANEVAAASDAYKRHVFQSTIVLPNPTGRRTP